MARRGARTNTVGLAGVQSDRPLAYDALNRPRLFVTEHFIHSSEWTLPGFDLHGFTFEFSPETLILEKGGT